MMSVNPIQNKRVTIIEVAEACGCSKTTVACALDERTAHKVAEKTRRKIFETVKRLGYLPNRSAKALRLRKNYTVGVMLPEPANSFYGNIVLNLQRELAKDGYTALFIFWQTRDDADTIRKAYDQLLCKGVDGIIAGDAPGVHFENSPVPVVYWKMTENIDSFSSFPYMKEVYEELFVLLEAKGCGTYAILAPDMNSGRAAIIREIMAEKKIPIREEFMLDGITSPEQAGEVMSSLLKHSKKWPDAVLANNDYIALASMAVALEQGIAVPEKMKFVGFDGIQEGAYLYPSLTTFYVPPAEIAKKLVYLFLRRQNEPDAPFQTLSLKPELIVRNST